MLKKAFLLLPVLLLTLVVFAQQSKADLEKERAAIKRDIDELNNSLKQTTKTKKATVGQLSLVLNKLRLRMAEINTISKQINLIEGDIYQSNRDIYKLKKELDTLKLQYEKSVVYAYKNRSNYDFLNFLFSSTNFNDALKRIAYLRSYRAYREQQAENIYNTQALLKQKITGLNENKKKKGDALEEENKQRSVLEEEKQEKNAVIAGLKSREKELNKQLKDKTRRDQKLKSAIDNAVRRETEKAMAEARRREKEEAGKTATKPATTAVITTPGKESTTAKPARPKSLLEATPEGAIISADFEKNKGRLPWPLEKANIKIHFGPYSIEGTPLKGDNPGLTFETDPNASVKAIFEGVVSAVFDVEDQTCVMIRHGKYFSVYSNLVSASVSKGQKVSAGQTIGRASTNNDDNGEIEFVLMQESRKLNPEQWIRRR